MRKPYDKAFYSSQANGSERSASFIVPLVLSVVKVTSVVDVGCGLGTWLRVFKENGVTDILGIDGDYVDRTDLRIPEDAFMAMDLRHEIKLGRRFDLACSLEVAEHLPLAVADNLVSALVRLAPLVLFSAAIPGQGGTDHINEQFQSFWAERFAQHGYEVVDLIRPQIYGSAHVEWWYQQNVLLFCGPGHRPAGYEPVTSAYDLNRIHPSALAALQARPQSGKEAIEAISRGAGVLARKLKERLVGA